MPRPVLFLDVSRLVRRYEHFGGPTGIDRVEMRYAEWLMRQDAFVPRPVAQTKRGLVALREEALHRLIATLKTRWSAETPRQVGRNGRSTAAWVVVEARRHTRRFRLFAGARPLDAGSAPNVTLSVGHDGLDQPSRFAGLPGPFAALLSDVIPLTHPEYEQPRFTEMHARRVATLEAHAAHVFTISEATRCELLKVVPRPRFDVSVVHIGPGLSPPPEPARFARPTFVHLSSIERRKNVAFLLQVWRELAREADPPQLLVIGRFGDDPTARELIERCEAIRPHVSATGGLGDRWVAERLAGARGLLSASFAEGFGLPLVEARLFGVPAIASDIPAHREVGGTSTLYLSPLDGPGWRQAILSLARDDALRADLVSRITPPYSWEEHFAAVTERLLAVAAPLRCADRPRARAA